MNAKGPEVRELVFQHTSMQFSDSAEKMKQDAEVIFGRNKDILTGTEAGGDTLRKILRDAAKEHGYRYSLLHGDAWIAVKEDLVDGGWEDGYVPVLQAGDGEGKHGDRGINWVSWDNDELGHITVGAGHYLTNGRHHGQPNFELNVRFAQEIKRWGHEAGKGSDVVFYCGDQNIVDRTGDTFMGAPFTSAWDEVGKHQNTGHGNIDVIASYDKDGRVTATSIKALDDSKVDLNTDHFMVVATFDVKVLRKHK